MNDLTKYERERHTLKNGIRILFISILHKLLTIPIAYTTKLVIQWCLLGTGRPLLWPYDSIESILNYVLVISSPHFTPVKNRQSTLSTFAA